MKIQYLLFILLFISCSGDDSPIDIPIETNEAIYFPPNGTDEWETVSLSELNWNESNLQPLLDFVEEKNSKSFIVLHNGK